MKKAWATKLLALFLSLVLLAAYLPAYVRAEEPSAGETQINMTAGEVRTEFAEAGASWISDDPSIAWIDENGNLNAMRAGETTVTVGGTETTVIVAPYSDDSGIVGNLRILARFNDDMKFYDGHVYLLFTSYQDGVEICVPDLYGMYEISDAYYRDIRKDIANGSNHTGTDTDKYFTFSDQKNSVTLNRGEIVTIGMYRDFDLTVPQAALGSLKNGSLYKGVSDAAKKSLAELFFKILNGSEPDLNAVKEEIKAAVGQEDVSYEMLIDGVVDGGVCFNRELYNQKLEWDQYENVTYGMDITRDQLGRLQEALNGNKSNFSILNNSCATVALRAWNAAVGTAQDGTPNAYYLEAKGKGIFALMDAPKTVRDGIKAKLPGYCLNNAAGVAEEGMSFQDETGFVYVSSPAKVETTYEYDGVLKIDEERTFVPALVRAANGVLSYSDNGQVRVGFQTSENEGATNVEKIIFSSNETSADFSDNSVTDDGIWFVMPAAEGSFVVDGEGNALPSVYENGNISFYTGAFPFTYKIVSEEGNARNVLVTQLAAGAVASEVKVFRVPEGGDPVEISFRDEVPAGETIRVEITPGQDEEQFAYLTNVTLNGESFAESAAYDDRKGVYAVELVMPDRYSVLTIETKDGTIKARNADTTPIIQAFVGDKLKAEDYAEYSCEGVYWEVIPDLSDTLEAEDNILTVKSTGGVAMVMVVPCGNPRAGVVLAVETIASRKEKAVITFDQETADSIRILYDDKEDDEIPGNVVPFSGFMVPNGSVLSFEPKQEDETVLSLLTCGARILCPGDTYVADHDVLVKAMRKKATVKGMPATLSLKAKGSSSKFSAKVRYSGSLAKYTPVFDSSIRYESSNPELVSVDKKGKVTVVGEVPAEGAAVYVTAYAGSGNDKVKASCKVMVGNYDGAKKAGMLTVYARTITKAEPVAHSSLVFTSYDDVDLNVSYFLYHKPNEKYKALMEDYRDHPEKYSFDPALYNENALGLTEDRATYFDDDWRGAKTEPVTVSLKAGESVSMSNYDFSSENFIALMDALKDSDAARTPAGALLLEKMQQYLENGTTDPEAFDAILGTLKVMYLYTKMTGRNPAGSPSFGGLILDREMLNQFRYMDYLAPINYYQIEITRDELALLEDYLSNPENNYYSLFNKNCTSGVVEMWNRVTAGHRGLKLNASLTKIAKDPQSLYFELGLLRLKSGLDGQGGTDYRPRCVAYKEGKVPENVTLNVTKKTLKVGKSFKLKAEISPSNSGHVEYESSNTEVATVTAAGRVRAVGSGKAVITATTPNGVSASCQVTVKGVPVYQLVKDGIYRYTTKVRTVKYLIRAGWEYSKSFESSDSSGTKVYEIYYKKLKTYAYTASRQIALAAKKAGNKVAFAFYGSLNKDDPVYQVSDNEGKSSIFTTSRTLVRKMRTLGWIYQGIAWYAVSNA